MLKWCPAQQTPVNQINFKIIMYLYSEKAYSQISYDNICICISAQVKSNVCFPLNFKISWALLLLPWNNLLILSTLSLEQVYQNIWAMNPKVSTYTNSFSHLEGFRCQLFVSSKTRHVIKAFIWQFSAQNTPWIYFQLLTTHFRDFLFLITRLYVADFY